MKRYMTRKEMMEYFSIGENAVTKWEKEGLPFIDMGRNTHFYKDTDIEDFLDGAKSSRYTRI